jgi:ribosomal protein S18 acetylase RimI-like enzyme
LNRAVSERQQLVFREATDTDVPELIRMMRCLALQEPVLPFDEREVASAWAQFFSSVEFGRAWLFYAGDELAGYVILTLGYSFEYRGRDAFVDELYVEGRFRGRGLGRQVMEFVEARARERGVNAVHLEVDRGNEAALALYRRSGYANHGRYLMTKWLRRPDS